MTKRTAHQAETRTVSDADFVTPIEGRYFEDYQVGAIYEYGYAIVGEAEMIDFAARFDPQPIHVDPQFAATGPFGGLIASGWLTCAIFMRLFADHYLSRTASLASPGIDEMRWSTPVRAGDSLRLQTTILDTRRSRSKPDRGLVRTRAEVLNQDDGNALSLIAMNLIALRGTSNGL